MSLTSANLDNRVNVPRGGGRHQFARLATPQPACDVSRAGLTAFHGLAARYQGSLDASGCIWSMALRAFVPPNCTGARITAVEHGLQARWLSSTGLPLDPQGNMADEKAGFPTVLPQCVDCGSGWPGGRRRVACFHGHTTG